MKMKMSCRTKKKSLEPNDAVADEFEEISQCSKKKIMIREEKG